jgi:transcriptional regulator with XRE-family HTH domain
LFNREIARRAGIDESYLSKLVRGSRCPSLVIVERLIGVLDFTLMEEELLRSVAVLDRGKARRYV